MADINALIALGGPGLQKFDLSTLGSSVEDLRAKILANQTGQFNLQEAQGRRAALDDYNQRQNAGDPNALAALNAQPDALSSIVTSRNAMSAAERAQFDYVLGHRARAANAVAQFPAGTPERQQAWNAQLDELLANKAISPDQYKKLYGSQPSDLLLQQYIAAGLQVPQYMDYAVKRAGIGAAQSLAGAVAGAVQPGGGSASAAPAGDNDRRLVQSESGGNPALVNQFGFAGTYQFGAPRLAALGLYQPGPGENLRTWGRTYKTAPAKWSGEFRIPGFPEVKTLDDFLKNPAAQQEAFSLHKSEMNKEIADNGFDKYIGTRVGGVLITRDALQNMIHLGGVGSTRKALESDGRNNPADANGKTVMDYARMAPQGSPQTSAPARAAGAGAPDFVQSLVPTAMAALATPGVPESTAKLANSIIEWAKQDTKPTDLGKNYDDYAADERAAGRIPMSRFDYSIATKRAGAANVSVETKGETAEAAQRGKDIAVRLDTIAKQGDEAYQQRNVVGRLGNMLEQSGTGANIAFANFVRENFGEQIGKAFMSQKRLDAAQAATALINYMKPRMRVAGSGSSSDRDMDAFGKSIPSLLSTVGGRRIVIETLGGIQQALIDRGDVATRYQTGELTAPEAFKQMRALGDPFKSFREYQAAQQGEAGAPAATLPHFKDPSEVARAIERKKLGPGDQFIIDDGRGLVGTVPGTAAPAGGSATPPAAASSTEIPM